MPPFDRRAMILMSFAALAACGRKEAPQAKPSAGAPAEVNYLISKYSREYEVPEDLVHRVVKRESGYNPAARHSNYYGLMQIMPQTARTMGHRGAAEELLDAETNLKYGVKYLRGAWLVSRGNRDRAVSWYSSGYYYEAKRMGILREAGLKG